MKKVTSRLRSTPGIKDRDRALDAFAAGALAAQDEIQDDVEEQILPWQEPYVREDVMKQVLLKMPEPLYLKLKYLTSYTPYNMTSFILEKIGPEIEKEIMRLTAKRR